MEFTSSIKNGFKNYKNFNGKANRLEFWWFLIFVVLGIIISSILDRLIFEANFISSNSSIGWIGSVSYTHLTLPTILLV